MLKSVEYVRLRLATDVGRSDTIRWAWAAIFAVVIGVAMAFLLISRTAAVTVDQYVEALETIRSGNVDSSILPPIVAIVAVLLFFSSFPSAVKTVCLYRPWRPHSGGTHITQPSPETLPIRRLSESVLAEIRQNIELKENALPSPRYQNTQNGPPPAIVPDVATDVSVGGYARPLPLEAILPAGMQMFPLYDATPGMTSERYNTIAFILYGGRVDHSELAERLHIPPSHDIQKAARKVHKRLRRAKKDGWVEQDRKVSAFWIVPDRIVTDLDLLSEAIEKGDETLAASVAAALGPPLPLLEEGHPQHIWAFKKLGKQNVVDDLLVKIANLIDTATEQWRNNPTFPATIDQVYDTRPNIHPNT